MPNEPVAPFEDTRELRQELIHTCLVMRDKLGYFVSTWGNISVRVKQGLVVTPSRVPYEQIQPEDLVLVSWEGVRLLGKRVPSSETELHRQLMLERPDFGALIHSHSPWASVCACAHRSIPVLVDDMAEVIGGPIQCAAHVPAGRHKALAESVRRAIGPDATAVLMANHGVMVGARNLQEATAASVVVEKAAMILIHAEAIGGAKPIGEESWREERHRYLYRYGKPEDLVGVITESK